jgi:hypothetical protein
MPRTGGALVLAFATLLAACGTGSDAEAGEGQIAAERQAASQAQEVAMHQGEFVDLLRSSGGRYSKHGWNHYGPGYFELDRENGVLTAHGGMGLLWYAVKEFSDFELELEFKCSQPNSNSGVFLRVPGVPSSDDYIYHSFEIQIDDSQEGIHHTGAAYDAEAPTCSASRPTGEWNRFVISFVGDRIRVELNGEAILDWQAEPRGKVEDFASRGYIGLQNHDDESPVYFRNIRVREIG